MKPSVSMINQARSVYKQVITVDIHIHSIATCNPYFYINPIR